MRLATLRVRGETRAARLEGGEYVLLPFPDLGCLLSSEGWRIRAEADGERVAAGDAEFATLLPSPNKIIGLAANYASHVLETGRNPPKAPMVFAKYDGALIGPYDRITLPWVSDQVDWEAELAFVVGRPARHVPRERALEYVAGYTVVNDVTVRDYQRKSREALAGKTFEGTTPVGPVLVTPEEFGGGEPDLEISCAVDGEVMQRSRTSDLIFGIADILSFMSDVITLRPGDLICTGTPGGVGNSRDPQVFLRAGQILTTRVEGIGELRNLCVPECVPEQR